MRQQLKTITRYNGKVIWYHPIGKGKNVRVHYSGLLFFKELRVTDIQIKVNLKPSIKNLKSIKSEFPISKSLLDQHHSLYINKLSGFHPEEIYTA